MNTEEMKAYSLISMGSDTRPVEQRLSVRRGQTLPARDGAWRILRGWAAQQRHLSDRRQTVALLISGDLAPEVSHHYDVVALTDLELVRLHHTANDDVLALAEAARGRLIDHAARLAGYGAYERMGDLLLEIYQRLRTAGLTTGLRFPFPIGQEQLGNMLGMSAVHVNRTLAKLRAEGHLLTGSGWYALPNPDRLRIRVVTGGDVAWSGRSPTSSVTPLRPASDAMQSAG